MGIMDYRDYTNEKVPGMETEYPMFLYETGLASKDAISFDLLKKKLMSRLHTMGIQVAKTCEKVFFLP